MFLQFKIKNFKSIQDEQTLNLLKSSSGLESNNIKSVIFTPIYGSNGSGKSNVLSALKTFINIINASSAYINLKENYNPFVFQKNKEPTEFELIFTSFGEIYRYGFSYTDEEIKDEWLFCKKYKGKSETNIFYRHFEKSQTCKNKLCLNKNSENELYSYLSHVLDEQIHYSAVDSVDDLDKWFTRNKDKNLTKSEIGLLKEFGIDFTKLNYEFNDISKKFKCQLVRNKKNFNLEKESYGIKQVFKIWLNLIYLYRYGGVLVVDDLDHHLHPILLERMINNFYNNCEKSYKEIQIICSLHNTSIMKPSLLDKDQIYFTEKNNCNTELYSLLEFKSIKENEDYEKNYLIGNYCNFN